MDGDGSGDTTGSTNGNPVIQQVIVMTVSDGMMAMTGVRILLVGHSVLDGFGVEGEG